MRPNKDLIEERFKESIDAWVQTGRPTGDFLLAVLSNDLKEAISRGDGNALDNLPHIVAYLYCDCPSLCWGAPENVKAWATWIAKPENREALAAIREAREGTP